MKKKHQLATWTVGVTLFASLSPAFALADGSTAVPVVKTAETGLSQQQALDLVKKMFLIDDSYKLTHVGRNEAGKSQAYYGPYLPGTLDSWDFNFTKGDGANASNMYVSVNAQTGTIRSFSLNYNRGVQSDDSDSISADAAKQIALSWIAKLAPDQAKFLDEGKALNQNSFRPNIDSTSFRFNRLVNGIPFLNDGVNLTISSHGDLLNYYLNWSLDDSKFPAAASVITQDQASKTFAALPLSLRYVQQWMPYADGPNVQLIYTSGSSYGFNGSMPVVDAVYGTLIDGTGKPVSASVYTLAPIAAAPGAPLITSPLTDKDAAVAFVKKLLNIDDSYTLSNSNYNTPGDTGKGPKTWNLSFTKASNTSTPDKPMMNNLSVTINADTGEVMNYWNNNMPADNSTSNTGTNNTLTWDQAVQKAKDFLMKVAPTQVNNLALQNTSPINGGKFPNAYMVNFTRLVNGIPFDYVNTNVSVNQYTGEILNYNGNYNNPNLNYPDPAKAISLQNAQAAFAGHYKMQLQYVIQPGTPANGTQPATDPVPKLVYAPINTDDFGNVEVLDAISGQFVSLNGQPVHQDVMDIKDHWAAKQLQDFADRGIIEVKNGKVTPDQQLTRAKALHLLLLAVRNPYFFKTGASSQSASAGNDIAAAKAAGWIDKDMTDFRPNDFLTREELADFAAHVMGYGKLASKQNIFKNLYTDIANDDNYLGDIAIVNALGVMKGDGADTFSPKGKVTLAQAVVVADRIVKLQGSGPIFRPY